MSDILMYGMMSISLAVLDRDAAFFVARAEAERLVTTGISIGTRIDLYCSAATCRNVMRCIATRMALVSLLNASPVCYD
jgi:hypothetical protein